VPLRAVVFLAVVRFAADLRAVVRLAAAGATLPPSLSRNGTVSSAMLTPLARAFPPSTQCFVSRVALVPQPLSRRIMAARATFGAQMRCVATASAA
jgi:hypothetical protein